MLCADVAGLQEAFLALELDVETEAELRRHVQRCDACRAAVGHAEPAVWLALRLADREESGDAAFVGEVLAGVHQRAFERQLGGRRRRWTVAAAAVVVAVAGGWMMLRRGGPAPDAGIAATRNAPAAVEPAFVEVEGDGVRLYQFDTTPQEPVRVAFIVDPQLEL